MEGRIFFANAAHIAAKVHPLIEQARPKVVAIHLRGVPDLEYTALKSLTLSVERWRERGVTVWLVGMNPGVFDMVSRSQLGKTLGPDAMLFNLEIAVAKYLDRRPLQAVDVDTDSVEL